MIPVNQQSLRRVIGVVRHWLPGQGLPRGSAVIGRALMVCLLAGVVMLSVSVHAQQDMEAAGATDSAASASVEAAVSLPDTDLWLSAISRDESALPSLLALTVLDDWNERMAGRAAVESVSAANTLPGEEDRADSPQAASPPQTASELQSQLQSQLQSRLDRLQRIAARLEGPALSALGADIVSQSARLELAQQQQRLWSADTVEQVVLARRARRLLFNQSDESLAAAWLPAVLRGSRIRSADIWRTTVALAEANPEASAVLREFADRVLADTVPVAAIDPTPEQIQRYADQVLTAGPLPADLLPSLRRGILQAVAAEEMPRVTGLALLDFNDAMNSLQMGHYLAFAQELLPLTGLLLDERLSPGQGSGDQPLGDILQPLLQTTLPQVSEQMARQFALVDPALNNIVAGLYNILTQLPDAGVGALENLAERLADLNAALDLGIPDMGFYFAQPVRTEIAEEIDICVSIAVNRDSTTGTALMTREQFDACLENYVDLALTVADRPELAGDPDGPFASSQLRRELSLVPWQRINYLTGFVEEALSAACEAPEPTLPNPLEWSMLAEQFRWLADQAPVFFAVPENRQRVDRMISEGRRLLTALGRQVDCVVGEGASARDPVQRALLDYEVALNELRDAMDGIRDEFRQTRLSPGADVQLDTGLQQTTSYRPEGLMIGPCNETNICEMSAQLMPTRGLLGLFPDPYLLADQTGMGTVSLCYDEVRWVDRRGVAPRRGETNVANYLGRFSFVLRGQFTLEGENRPVFTRRFTSPEEHQYLFAANRPEVLADECPMEWVGDKLVVPMKERRFNLVPDRLTYLAGARTLPSRLFAENWEQGAEWRDWFLDDTGVEVLLADDGAVLSEALTAHLARLNTAQEAAVYQGLLSGNGGQRGAAPAEALAELEAYKLAARRLLELFYLPDFLAQDPIRAAFLGADALLDRSAIRRLASQRLPVGELLPLAQTRLTAFREAWSALPDSRRQGGATPEFLAMALLALIDLEARYFSDPVAAESSGPAALPSSGAQEADDGLSPAETPTTQDAADPAGEGQNPAPAQATTSSSEPGQDQEPAPSSGI